MKIKKEDTTLSLEMDVTEYHYDLEISMDSEQSHFELMVLNADEARKMREFLDRYIKAVEVREGNRA